MSMRADLAQVPATYYFQTGEESASPAVAMQTLLRLTERGVGSVAAKQPMHDDEESGSAKLRVAMDLFTHGLPGHIRNAADDASGRLDAYLADHHPRRRSSD